MSETMRVDGASAQPVQATRQPSAAEIVDGYRTNGSLNAEGLAKAIYAESGGDMDRAQALKGALKDALGPFERGAVDRALDRQDGVSLGEHAVDGAAQFGKGVWEMAKGLGSLAWSGAKTAYDTNLAGLAVDKYEGATGRDLPDFLPSADRGAGRLEAGKDAILGLGKAVWNDPSILIAEYKTLAADGRYGAIVGQAAVDFGDLLIGAKGAGKAGKVASVAGRLDGAADVAKVAKAADTASELARAVRAVPGGTDEAAGALKATRAALDEIDVSKLPDDVAKKVNAAKSELRLAGAGYGSWPRSNVVENVPSALKQANESACGPTCGAMVLRDRGVAVVPEDIGNGLTTFMKGAPDNLIDKVNDATDNIRWAGGQIDPAQADQVLSILNREGNGSWIAELRDPGPGISHAVVVDGVDAAGNIKVRDPWDASSYTMTADDFKAHWAGGFVAQTGN